MSKRRTYSQTELVDMTVEELEEIVNREAERINRQISRARKRGLNLEEVYTKSEIARPLRQERLARAVAEILSPEYQGTETAKGFLLKQYAAMQETDFTKAGFQTRKKEREELARDLGVEEEDITAQHLFDARKAMRRATGDAGMFYQVLVKAVESGVATNYNYFRNDEKLYYQTLTRRGRQEFIQQQLDVINNAIVEENKQRDEKGVAKHKDLLTMVQLRNKAKR